MKFIETGVIKPKTAFAIVARAITARRRVFDICGMNDVKCENKKRIIYEKIVI